MTSGEKMIWTHTYIEHLGYSRANYPTQSDAEHFERAATFATNHIERLRAAANETVDRMGTTSAGMLIEMLGGELAE